MWLYIYDNKFFNISEASSHPKPTTVVKYDARSIRGKELWR